VLAVGAVACWTWYPLRNADWLRDHPGRSPRTWATAQGVMTLPLAAVGYAVTWVFMAASGDPFPMPFGPRPEFFIFLMVSIGLLASWLGTLCWNEASQRLPTALAGQLIVFETLAALAYGLWDYHRISQLYLSEADRAPGYQHDALAKARGSWLFASQVEFAEFTTTPLTPANARAMADLGERVMHYSPEPQVAEKLVEAWRRAGDEGRANWHEIRFRVAFPEEYGTWKRGTASPEPHAESAP